jgi:hypothetical protein
MRIIKTRLVVVAGALLFGFFFRLGEDRAAGDPVRCSTWPCSDVYSWWTGQLTPAKASISAEKAGTIIPDRLSHTTQALVDLYIPASPGQKPLVQYAPPDDTFDEFQWPDHTPACKNADGTYPTPQSSQVAGTPAKSLFTGVPHYHCTGP